jgi:hypothetical protein
MGFESSAAMARETIYAFSESDTPEMAQQQEATLNSWQLGTNTQSNSQSQ